MTGNVGRQRRLFDLWASTYDWPRAQLAYYQPVQDVVLGQLRGLPARRILDVACGTGILAERLAHELGTDLVCGCDSSGRMLEKAAARRAARWVQADAQYLPLSSGSLDVVVCTESFQWFPGPDAVLTEFHRVLAPGGLLVVETVNMRTASVAWVARASAALLGQPAYWATLAEVESRVRRAGFGNVRRQRVPRFGGFLLPAVLIVASAGSPSLASRHRRRKPRTP